MTSTRSLDSERSVYFGACQATELAFESNGQGDFTRIALPRLREFLTGTNQQFLDAVLGDFGDARRQTPVLLPPELTSRTFLAPVSEAPTSVGAGRAARPAALAAQGTRRARGSHPPRAGGRLHPPRSGRPDRVLLTCEPAAVLGYTTSRRWIRNKPAAAGTTP